VLDRIKAEKDEIESQLAANEQAMQERIQRLHNERR
jgi:hypothetical protein